MMERNYYFFLSILMMMGSMGLFAADIYLPALPTMSNYFNCSQADIQASFTVFLLGLASCQFVSGGLIDKFGRKKIALFGFSLFTLASLACAFSTSLSQFIFFRFMQAIGSGVGSVLIRVLIADRYNREESIKVFSTIFPVIGLSPALAPLVGGYLTNFFGWQTTFFFMVGFGIILIISLFFALDPRTKRRDDIERSPVSSMQGYLEVIRNVEFIGYALVIGCGFCVFRSYAVESPFVFSNQGFGAEEIGQFYISLSLAYFVGNLIAKKLVTLMRVEKVLRIGFAVFVIGGILLVTSSYVIDNNAYAIIVPMTIVTLGNGFLFPIGSAAAMTAVSNTVSGTASGLLGALQCIFSAMCIHWVGELCHGHPMNMSLFIGTLILLGFCSYLFLVVYRPKARVTAS